MATQPQQFSSKKDTPATRIEATKDRERALSRMLMTYIITGLAFMLLPGTFLGVWNLISISGNRAANSISPAWIQAHGQAQVFGWIGTFILGIGFYSIPKMRRAQAFAMWEAWACWAMWTLGVLLRWMAAVYEIHWRTLLPVAAAVQLLAFLVFFKTVSSHRPESTGEKPARLDSWIFVVIAGTTGLLATLILDLIGTVRVALYSANPALGTALNSRLLVLMAWGFMVPFVWGFSARWLSTFLGLRAPCNRGLVSMIAVNTLGITLAMGGYLKLATWAFFTSTLISLVALRLLVPVVQPAKTKGIHRSFPYFVRFAYVWLMVAASLGIWAAWARSSDGIWGASRHALTVGFVATMVFAIGPRVLPAFSGMRLLYSPKVMALSLSLLTIGCAMRVVSEVLAYQQLAQVAWTWLPVSAVIELTAVTLFAVNLVFTFRSAPPSQLVKIR